MVAYEIIFARSARKELERLNDPRRSRIPRLDPSSRIEFIASLGREIATRGETTVGTVHFQAAE